jgi:hypothetical protein
VAIAGRAGWREPTRPSASGSWIRVTTQWRRCRDSPPPVLLRPGGLAGPLPTLDLAQRVRTARQATEREASGAPSSSCITASTIAAATVLRLQSDKTPSRVVSGAPGDSALASRHSLGFFYVTSRRRVRLVISRACGTRSGRLRPGGGRQSAAVPTQLGDSLSDRRTDDEHWNFPSCSHFKRGPVRRQPGSGRDQPAAIRPWTTATTRATHSPAQKGHQFECAGEAPRPHARLATQRRTLECSTSQPIRHQRQATQRVEPLDVFCSGVSSSSPTPC